MNVEAPRLRALIERSSIAQAAGPDEQRECCGLCGLPIPPEHRHVLDLRHRELRCACRACSLLFDHSAAGGGHWRLIPDRCVRLDDLRLDELDWLALGIPVGIAFFVRDGERARVSAFYPSPAGATESRLPLEAWSTIEANNPALASIEPDVEALLVDRTGATARAYIVGLEACYRLVAVVRAHWRGFTGGDAVWRELERFFAALDARGAQEPA